MAFAPVGRAQSGLLAPPLARGSQLESPWFKLYGAFLDAGFAEPRLARQSVVGAGDETAGVAALILDLANTLRPEIVGRGIASSEAFEETMLALPTEIDDRRTVLVAHGQFCVWDHVD